MHQRRVFDNKIVEKYHEGEHNCSGWYDYKNHKPHNSFIKGDTSTTINLGWFIEIDGLYYLTITGEINYKIWLLNNGAKRN